MKYELIIGKYCKTSFKNGFVLKAVVTDINDVGVLLTTNQKTSFFNMDTVENIVPMDGE